MDNWSKRLGWLLVAAYAVGLICRYLWDAFWHVPVLARAPLADPGYALFGGAMVLASYLFYRAAARVAEARPLHTARRSYDELFPEPFPGQSRRLGIARRSLGALVRAAGPSVLALLALAALLAGANARAAAFCLLAFVAVPVVLLLARAATAAPARSAAANARRALRAEPPTDAYDADAMADAITHEIPASDDPRASVVGGDAGVVAGGGRRRVALREVLDWDRRRLGMAPLAALVALPIGALAYPFVSQRLGGGRPAPIVLTLAPRGGGTVRFADGEPVTGRTVYLVSRSPDYVAITRDADDRSAITLIPTASVATVEAGDWVADHRLDGALAGAAPDSTAGPAAARAAPAAAVDSAAGTVVPTTRPAAVRRAPVAHHRRHGARRHRRR